MQTTKDFAPVIMLELNELCPPILDRMMADGRLPNFKQLYDTADTFVTHTDDPTLEPWVQWPTLHTGQPESVHGAKELDEGHLIKTQRVWDRLAEDGVKSLIFSAMNGDTARPDMVSLVPDPWSAGVSPTDPEFEIFHQFISFHVAEHTNPNAKLDKESYAKFMMFMLKKGLSVDTIQSALEQLISEKMDSRERKWRRAMILDRLMWDVFAKVYSKQKPGFATYFANSTAYLQHRYWRHMSPESYVVKPSDEEMKAYGDAIEESYVHMDRLIGKARRLLPKNGRLIFATALSQQANTAYESIGGKFVYRPADFRKLFDWIGGPRPTSFEPVMTHQAWATYESDEAAIEGMKLILSIQSNGKQVMAARRTNNRVMFWCDFISKVSADTPITLSDFSKTADFVEFFNLIGQVNNSKHCRDGAFWVQTSDGSSSHREEKLPLEQTFSKILECFSVSGTKQETLEAEPV